MNTASESTSGGCKSLATMLASMGATGRSIATILPTVSDVELTAFEKSSIALKTIDEKCGGLLCDGSFGGVAGAGGGAGMADATP